MANPSAAPAPDLFPPERAALILERLHDQGRVWASGLAVELRTSEYTIRRDLKDLAAAGLCKRVYGGALLVSLATASLAARMGQDTDRKGRLARAAATLVQPGSTLLMDAGSTNVAIADALPDHLGLTVITNAPEICVRLGDRPGFQVLLIGGLMGHHGGGTLGATALLQVQQIKADLCFLGACAFDPTVGAAAFDSEEAELKRAMVLASGQLALAMTTEKLMTTAPFLVASASALDHLVVEPDLPAEWLGDLRACCGTVLEAHP